MLRQYGTGGEEAIKKLHRDVLTTIADCGIPFKLEGWPGIYRMTVNDEGKYVAESEDNSNGTDRIVARVTIDPRWIYIVHLRKDDLVIQLLGGSRKL